MTNIGHKYETHGYRGLLDGTGGSFHRIQFAAKYVFGYHNIVADEKK